MTVYVDNARIPFGRMKMSHMTADTVEELHAIADRLAMRREWFQTCRAKCGRDGDPCVHWHYDVGVGVRTAAIAAGAVEVDMHQMGEILRQRRKALRASG